MKKSELREIIREETNNVIRHKTTLTEGILGKLMELIWTLTGTKNGLFKAIQSQYGKDVDKHYKQINQINDDLRKVLSDLEKSRRKRGY